MKINQLLFPTESQPMKERTIWVNGTDFPKIYCIAVNKSTAMLMWTISNNRRFVSNDDAYVVPFFCKEVMIPKPEKKKNVATTHCPIYPTLFRSRKESAAGKDSLMYPEMWDKNTSQMNIPLMVVVLSRVIYAPCGNMADCTPPMFMHRLSKMNRKRIISISK